MTRGPAGRAGSGDGDPVGGVERAFFGPVSRAAVDAWLARAVRDGFGEELAAIAFRAGRIDAVYGLRLGDGRAVVLKVHRPPAAVPALTARQEAMRHLAAAGYPCPEPLHEPAEHDGHVVTLETQLAAGTSADAGRPEIRRALARSLAEHIELLRGVSHLAPRLRTGPAWTRYERGPWPVPHDPIFDFSRTPDGYGWLDDFARRAADELCAWRAAAAPAIGHGDWCAGNVRFADDRVVATFDWDLVTESEAVLAGLSAGGYLDEVASSDEEVAAFVADFDAARPEPFTAGERRAAAAAARWVLAFNARCVLSNLGNRAGRPTRSCRRARRCFACATPATTTSA